MAWPKGRERPKKVRSPAIEPTPVIEEAPLEIERAPNGAPLGWRKGQLLNVRNRGEFYVITLWPNEYSPEYEDQCIKFTNLGECQDFVSRWYAAEHHDPRAR